MNDNIKCNLHKKKQNHWYSLLCIILMNSVITFNIKREEIYFCDVEGQQQRCHGEALGWLVQYPSVLVTKWKTLLKVLKKK